MGRTYEVTEVTSRDTPEKRLKVLAGIEAKAGRAGRRQVIVSTYQLLSMGVDGLQRYSLVRVGEPRTNKDTEQAENRLHRSGQEETVHVYRIYGAVGSLD
ncbi:hypothetical protein G6O67_006871 [Ophiocordyceps sinensis]|uniref:Uncharacterized protein n=2 Tax=Ophiocordyceps sinensis TaxID=72228 RepID=A0A8H4PP92_9HYPO|nr:hypothetical protein OCS_01787 [Ophiocordyceps sinensis CO18]KAF4506830.1 hypothetical protein G6O67_006871 [Ophiocordyceps sinensis]